MSVTESEIVSACDQELSQSQTAEKLFALQGRATQQSRDTRKTTKQSNQFTLAHQYDCKTRMGTK